jgi:hypothetical protein
MFIAKPQATPAFTSDTTSVPPTGGLTVVHLLAVLCAGVILWTVPIMLGTMVYWHFAAPACH